MGRKVDLNQKKNSDITRMNKNTSKRNIFRNMINNDNLNETAENKVNQQTSTDNQKNDISNIKIRFPLPIKMLTVIVIFVPFIILLLFVTVFGDFDGGSASSNFQGLSGHDYYPGACNKVKVNGKIITIEEYAAGVVINEVGGFTEETLKTFAIAARTFLMQTANKVGSESDCYYNVTDTSDRYQVYREREVPENIKKAVEDTRGLVITLNGKPRANYDASCVYTAAQAKSRTPNETFDDNYVYIRYGGWSIGGDNYQKIDKEKAKSIGSLNYYISKAESGNSCGGNHGGGLSQNGAGYLEAYEGYNYEKIINYYYQNKEKVVSIYKGTNKTGNGYSGNYPIEPDNELYTNNEFLIKKSLSEMLSENGSSIEEFNKYLKSEIKKAGVGTREGSVAAAMTLIGSLAEQGYKINYQWGGIHTNLGIISNIGTPASTDACTGSYAAQGYNSEKCLNNYRWVGFDCGGFVTWAIYNGMQGTTTPGGTPVERYKIFNSPETKLKSDKAVCKIGGVLQSKGHIVLVVGHDDANKQYIVAEATGSKVSNNTGGVKLTYYPYGNKGLSSGYWCSNLDEMYGD